MPTRSIRNLMRARARLARRSSWRSKIRRTASETFRYSPSSIDANSQKRAADARHDRRAAAGADLEALHRLAVDLADARDEAEVVDQRDRTVVRRRP